ncbi:hypothetical protein F908_02115 [Acinetobacter sp. NIPH 284]|nr:hypothetical protein F908_02115 [Acinetobacter sp. NIPH 284]
MKIIPEQTTTSLIHSSDQGLKLDINVVPLIRPLNSVL